MSGLPIIITNNCNYSCKTCIREYKHGENISLSVLNKVLPDAKKLGYKLIRITGGEPALHPKFELLIKTLVNHGLKFNFVSNGSLLDRYKFIIKYYKKYLINCDISLDASTAEKNDLIRHKGSFKNAVNSIKYFSSQGIQSSLSICLNRMNLSEIENMFILSKKIGLIHIHFAEIIETKYNKKLLLHDTDRISCANILLNCAKKYKMRVSISSSFKLNNIGIPFCREMCQYSPLAIIPNNNVIFCCGHPGEGIKIGNLLNNSLIDIYGHFMKLVYELNLKRLSVIKKRESKKVFNSCEFCYKELLKIDLQKSIITS